MESVTCPIELPQVVKFARALGEADPVYEDMDAAVEQGFRSVLTPPTFTQGLPRFFSKDVRVVEEDQSSGVSNRGEPFKQIGGSLHGEQHFEYFVDVCVGDVLTATTSVRRTWQKSGKSGTRNFLERVTEYHDESGVLVVRSTAVLVSRKTVAISGDA